MLYAQRIAEIDRTIDVNVMNQKSPKIIRCDDRQRLTFKNLAMQIIGNVYTIMADKNVDLKDIEVIDTTVPFVGEDLDRLKRRYKSEAMTYMGIEGVDTDKKERLIGQEVLRGMGDVEAMRFTRLTERQKAAEQINELFGLDVEVDFRSGLYIQTGETNDMLSPTTGMQSGETKSSPDDYSKCYEMLGLDKYPIFDESYRSFLNDKIIRHFYFREIGFETLAQFRWYMRTTMDENMPYFNQLYDSLNLIQDPITNQSYTWGEVYTMAQDEDTKTGTLQTDVLGQDTITNENTVTKFGKTVDETDERRTDTEQDTKYGKTDTTTTKYGRTDTDSGDSTKTTDYGKTEDTTTTTTYGKTQHTANSGADTVMEGATHERVIHSDTPMNQISNSGVENLNYASDVTYTDRNGTGVGTTTYGGVTDITTGGSDTTETDSATGGRDTVTTTTHGNKSAGGSDNVAEVLGGKDEVDVTVKESGSRSLAEGGTQTVTDTKDSRTDSTKNSTGEVSTDRNLDEHGNREHNRKGYDGTSPSKLLAEYRDTFLNVDLQVIHSLDILFFGLWN